MRRPGWLFPRQDQLETTRRWTVSLDELEEEAGSLRPGWLFPTADKLEAQRVANWISADAKREHNGEESLAVRLCRSLQAAKLVACDAQVVTGSGHKQLLRFQAIPR